MSTATINFGKYKGKTFHEVADENPSYITFLLNSKGIEGPIREFIMEKIIDHVKIGFGKYANKPYNEVLNKNPDYLIWLSKNTKHSWLVSYLKKYGALNISE